MLKRNVIANLVGSGWSAAMSIVFIPLYIHFMGIESYALVGIQVALMTISSVLDMGMSPTINREIARLTLTSDRAQEARDLTRTMEVITWLVALGIGLVIAVLAHPIAHYWLKPGRLTPEAVQRAVCLMGASLLLQWPVSFYSAGLMGLQKMVRLNVITMAMGTLRGAGAVAVLWLWAPTIEVFLTWQIVVNALQAAVLAVSLGRGLPRSGRRAEFHLPLIRHVWRFAAGMGAISILSVVISQADKFVLSKVLSLELFGYYTLASVVATSFSRLTTPIVSAMFPRFTQLVTLGGEEVLRKVFHQGCQVMSALTMPCALLLVFFSHDIIAVWTGTPATADRTYVPVAFLSLATLFNGLAFLPISLEYATGRTRAVLYVSIVTTISLVPAVVLGARAFGVVGAAAALMVVNFGYGVSLSAVTNRALLAGHRARWFLQDIGVPLAVTVAVVGAGRLVLVEGLSPPAVIGGVVLVAAVTMCAVACSMPFTRDQFLGHLRAVPALVSRFRLL